MAVDDALHTPAAAQNATSTFAGLGLIDDWMFGAVANQVIQRDDYHAASCPPSPRVDTQPLALETVDSTDRLADEGDEALHPLLRNGRGKSCPAAPLQSFSGFEYHSRDDFDVDATSYAAQHRQSPIFHEIDVEHGAAEYGSDDDAVAPEVMSSGSDGNHASTSPPTSPSDVFEFEDYFHNAQIGTPFTFNIVNVDYPGRLEAQIGLGFDRGLECTTVQITDASRPSSPLYPVHTSNETMHDDSDLHPLLRGGLVEICPSAPQFEHTVAHFELEDRATSVTSSPTSATPTSPSASSTPSWSLTPFTTPKSSNFQPELIVLPPPTLHRTYTSGSRKSNHTKG